jgi:PIF1-like helicase
MKNVRFLFLDEMSMIGLRLLNAIDYRLREIRPQYNDLPFGGISIVLFGDFAQLPPVADVSLYQSVTDKSPSVIQHTSRLYRNSFNRAFHLIQQMRQQEQDDMALKFQQALSHLRSGDIEREDWEFFQSKVLSNLPPEAQQEFDDAIILYSTNREVIQTNISMLEKVGSPVARIEAQYHGISTEAGASVESEYCNGLEHVLHLSVGCRVSSFHKDLLTLRSC